MGGSRIKQIKQMKRLSFWASLAMLMFAVGCETDEMAANNSQIELNLKGTISSLQKSTRVNSSGFEAEDKVGVYVSNRGSLLTSGNMVDNAAFIYNDGALAAESGEKVYWGSESVRLNVYAYYPYAASVADNTAYPFSVAANQSTEAAFYNSDFLTASALDLAPQTTPVELAFDHSLSRVNIILTAGTDITQEELSSAAKTFTLDGYILGGKINLSNGEAEVSTTSASTITPLAVDGTSYSAIVYPQSGTLTFTLNLNGEIYTYSAEYDYEAGYQYQYTLKINARKPIEMILESTSINPWEDGEPTEGEMSDIITFADAAFKEFLLSYPLYEKDDRGQYIESDKLIDANHDNEISFAEAEAVGSILHEHGDSTSHGYFPITNISDLKYFVNLEELSVKVVADENATNLDLSANASLKILYMILSPNVSSINLLNNNELRMLFVSGGSFSSVDLSKCVNLQYFESHGCKISNLNIGQCENLTYLSLYGSDLTKLDVSNNIALEYLECSLNELTSLNVYNNVNLTHLSCSENPIQSLNISNNLALESVYCEYVGFTELDVSANSNLQILSYSACENTVGGDEVASVLYMAEEQEIEDLQLGELVEIQRK